MQAFADMKAYFSQVVANNLDVIKALREEAAEARKREAAAEKLCSETVAENKRLVESLQVACWCRQVTAIGMVSQLMGCLL
jgi:Growth-arrest specific micro-tubule binding